MSKIDVLSSSSFFFCFELKMKRKQKEKLAIVKQGVPAG